jgi:4-amino-4-deoxy-L-arabinose transferase-like glycosyltransferase
MPAKIGQAVLRPGEVLLPLAIFALGVALRAFFAAQVTIVSPDGAFYGMLARKFLEQGFFDSLHVYWSPLYPSLTGMVAFFVGDVEQAGKMVSVLCGGALVIPAYVLADMLAGRPVAVVTAILVAFYPFLIEQATNTTSESLYALLFACMLVSGWLALKREQARYYGLTGALGGLLYLTRTEGCAYPLLFVVFGLLLVAWRRDKRTVLRTALGEVVLVLSFMAVASPYLLFIHGQMGRWSPGLRGLNLMTSVEEMESRAAMFTVSADGRHSPANEIIAEGRVRDYHPAPSSARVDVKLLLTKTGERLYKVYSTYQPTLLPGLIIVFLSLGLFATAWGMERLSREGYLLAIVACTVFGYSVVHVKERYFVGVIPIFLMWTAQGVVVFAGWLRGTLRHTGRLTPQKTVWLTVPITALLLLSFAPKYVKFIALGNATPKAEEHKHAGLWVKAHMGSGLVIMSRKPYVAFYGEGKHLYIPRADYAGILEYASRQAVDLLVIDEEWIPSEKPQLTFLLDEREAPKPLVPIYTHSLNDKKIILYRLDSTPTAHGNQPP